MGLTDDELQKRRRQSAKDLVRESGDASFLVEASMRLKRSMEFLSWVLIILTALLVWLALDPNFLQTFHFLAQTLHYLKG
jgi:uncharacterized Rmd1/YagE family protein